MKIDFVSDVVCPWCAIGLAALEQALDQVGDSVKADLHFQPFQLNPQMAPEGEEIVEHLSRKYGIDAAQIALNAEAIRQRGAELGFTFGAGKRSRTYNTFDAHRLLHWAGAEGPAGSQLALKHALLGAYFTDGRDPSQPAVLVELAEQVGLDAAEAARILASDRFSAEVRQAQDFYQQAGIHAVPAVIINDRHLIQGGQPVEVFERALRKIAAMPESAATLH